MTPPTAVGALQEFKLENKVCAKRGCTRGIRAHEWQGCDTRDSSESWLKESAFGPTNWLNEVKRTVPSAAMELRHISDAIDSSRSILDLENDWDGEGSLAYERPVWERAVRFLMTQANWARRTLDIIIDAPRILPGPNGSFDLHWKTGSYELLVNVPRQAGEPVDYYGDNLYENNPIRGTSDPTEPDRRLCAWISLFK